MDAYWASKPTDEIGKELMKRVEDYAEFLESSGMMAEMRRSYEKFYGSSVVKDAGVQGELAVMSVNHYASLIRSIHSMVTVNRPAWEPRATNTDTKSQAQTVLASGLLDYYAREKKMERFLKEGCLTALFLREAWVVSTWDATAGEMYQVDPELQTPVMEGDVRYKVYRLNDVVRDVNREDVDFDWIMLRDYVNKYDLAAKYPELADKIKGLNSDKQELEDYRLRPLWSAKEESDLIPRYTFYHRKSDALTSGRMVEFLSSGIVLFDGSLPYRRIPARRVAAEDMLEAAFGHSPALDLMPLQEALDTMFSTILTNQRAFGVQNVMVPKGSDLSVTSLAGGMNLIEYDQKLGEPKALQLSATSRETFDFLGLLTEHAQTISGVNAVARGNASPQLSGAAMALLQSTALQFSSGVQQAYNALIEDIGTDTIHLLADFANTKRVAYIVGKHNRSFTKEFSADDIADISRVTVDSANALTKTVAGRTEIANQLLQAGLIQRPEQYLMVIQTGQLEPMLENETSELLLIRAENEALAEGQPAITVATDNHAMHIMEHKSVLASPEARQDPNIVQATLVHIQEHITQLQTVDPALLQMLGQQSLMPMPAPQGAPGVMAPPQDPGQSVPGPQMPEPPADPITGQPLAQGA